MKKTLIDILKVTVSITVLIIATIAIEAIGNSVFRIDYSGIDMPGTNETIIGIVVTSIIQGLILILVANRSRLNKSKTGLLLTIVYFSINYLLNVIESLIYVQNIYPVKNQLVSLINGLFIAAITGFTIASLWSSKKPPEERISKFQWSGKIVLPWIGWTLTWFCIYITAGLLIPIVIPSVYDFYFGENAAMDISLVPIGYLAQIPRAAIWIFLTIGLQKYIRGTNLEKNLITGIVFGGIMSASLLIPNFLMSDIIRLSHLPEILFANMIWGFVISSRVQKRMTE